MLLEKTRDSIEGRMLQESHILQASWTTNMDATNANVKKAHKRQETEE
jgi:hypothetical protein